MSTGIQTFNTSGNLTIDETQISYVYIGKYAIPTYSGIYDIDVSCNGWPLVFFDIPYNLPDASGSSDIVVTNRYGICVRKITMLSFSSWRVTVSVSNYAEQPMGLYLRIFGHLHQNSQVWSPNSGMGFKVFNSNNEVVFDAGCRMFKLAGNTYDTELALTANVPLQDQPNNSCDTSITLPFSMQNKSIYASGRGTISYPYNIGGYTTWDGSNQEITEWHQLNYETMYYGTGNQLQVRRVATTDSYFETTGSFFIDNSGAQTVYSRLAVIDNTKFP